MFLWVNCKNKTFLLLVAACMFLRTSCATSCACIIFGLYCSFNFSQSSFIFHIPILSFAQSSFNFCSLILIFAQSSFYFAQSTFISSQFIFNFVSHHQFSLYCPVYMYEFCMSSSRQPFWCTILQWMGLYSTLCMKKWRIQLPLCQKGRLLQKWDCQTRLQQDHHIHFHREQWASYQGYWIVWGMTLATAQIKNPVIVKEHRIQVRWSHDDKKEDRI